MYLAGVSQSGELNRPNTIRPTEPGKTSSAGTGTNESDVGPLVATRRCQRIATTLARAKLARTVTVGAGIALMRSRIFSSTAVVLWVVKTLAAMTDCTGTDAWARAATSSWR